MTFDQIFTVGAFVVAALGLFYLVLFGQIGLLDRKSQRKQQKSSSSTRSVAHNLPARAHSQLRGKSEIIAQLTDVLGEDSGSPVVGIEGPPGIGKTAVALEIAWKYVQQANVDTSARPRFESIVWINCGQIELKPSGVRSMGKQPATEDVVVVIATTAGREDIRLAPMKDALELTRAHLAASPTLIVLDGLNPDRDRAIVEYFRLIPPASRAIITARASVPDARSVRISALDYDSALSVVGDLCSTNNVSIDEQECRDLARLSRGVPIVMAWTIGRISMGYDAHDVIARLEDPSRVEQLAEFCYDQTIAAIGDDDAMPVLQVLALLGGTAARDVLHACNPELTSARYDQTLVGLRGLALVDISAQAITMGGLAVDFTVARLRGTTELPLLAEQTIRGVLEQQNAQADALYRGAAGAANMAATMAAIDLANEIGLSRERCLLIAGISRYLYENGFFARIVRLWGCPVAIGTDPETQSLYPQLAERFALGGALYAYLRNDLGMAAYAYLKPAPDILSENSDAEMVETLNRRAIIIQRLGILARDLELGEGFEVSAAYLEDAVSAATRLSSLTSGDSRADRRLADALNGLASIHILRGELDLAVGGLEKARATYETLGDTSNLSSVHRHLATIYSRQNKHSDAVRFVEMAVEYADRAGRKDRLASALVEYAEIELRRGRKKRAPALLRRAEELYNAIGAVAEAEAVSARLKGSE